MSSPQPIVVVEAKGNVYARLQKRLQGIRSHLVLVHDYRDLQKVLRKEPVEWVLCDSLVQEEGGYVWKLIQANYPEISLLVFHEASSRKVAEELYEAGVLALEVDQLLEPDGSTLFWLLSVLHESHLHMHKLRENFRGKERLTRLGELTRGIFHDLNNRLTSMIGFLEMTKMHNPNLRDLDGVIAQCKQMDTMFTNVLRIARQERVRDIRPLNLNTVIREDLKLLEGDPMYRDFVVKEFDFDESLPSINGIYSDFSLSFLNIAKNAVEAMHTVDEKILRVATSHDDDWVTLTVEDTGIGIPEKDIPKIFLPFFTTKPIETKDGVPTGTGLGLANARELLVKYGTRWEVDSTLGVGTKIIVTIPAKNNLMDIPDYNFK
jgi:signal transduction histidine kinase